MSTLDVSSNLSSPQRRSTSWADVCDNPVYVFFYVVIESSTK